MNENWARVTVDVMGSKRHMPKILMMEYLRFFNNTRHGRFEATKCRKESRATRTIRCGVVLKALEET